MNTVTITRTELYEQLWLEATAKVAERYGISDVGLAKLCRKHDIPRPPRGYWAKKRFGKAPPKIPLPNPESDSEIVLLDPSECRLSSPHLQSEVKERIGRESQKEAKILVADTLRGSPRLVSRANQELRGAETDDIGLINPPKEAALDLHVSKASLRRALLIMDALLKALEERGYEVDSGPRVSMLDVDVHFRVAEQLETQREQPEDHDLDGPYEFGHSRFNTKRIPSGNLVLRVPDAYWAQGSRQSWRDGKQKRLEDRLNNVVAGLIKLAGRRKEHLETLERWDRERREVERRRQEEAQRRAERREQIRAEQERVDLLIGQAEQWRQSEVLRNFIEAAKQRHLLKNGPIEPDSEFAQWLNWATQHADRLDPLVESPPSVLDHELENDDKRDAGYSRW